MDALCTYIKHGSQSLKYGRGSDNGACHFQIPITLPDLIWWGEKDASCLPGTQSPWVWILLLWPFKVADLMTSEEFLRAICSQVLCHKQPVPSWGPMGFTSYRGRSKSEWHPSVVRFGQDHKDDESGLGASLAELVDQPQHSLLCDLGPAA